MKKRDKIIYWVATLWLSLGMVSTAIVQLLKTPEEVDRVTHLGYPVYLLYLLGTWKILGVIAVLAPGFPRIKEWAYAGFFFAMSGAVFSHVVSTDPAKEIFGPSILIVLTVISWHFRPASRRIPSPNSITS